MTTAPTVYTQFGYTLALAERSLTAVLQDHLAERGVRPETWYALQLLTVRGPVLERELLAADLASSRALNPDSTRALLARLEAEGLIRGDHEIELTDDGRALHRRYAGRARVLSERAQSSAGAPRRTRRSARRPPSTRRAGLGDRCARAGAVRGFHAHAPDDRSHANGDDWLFRDDGYWRRARPSIQRHRSWRRTAGCRREPERREKILAERRRDRTTRCSGSAPTWWCGCPDNPAGRGRS